MRPNCPAIRVTEIDLEMNRFFEGGAGGGQGSTGCLVITVTESGTKLWSITLHGGEVLDQATKDEIFYNLAWKYNFLPTKREKIQFLCELESIVLPRIGIHSMHRKSLIRKLRSALCPTKERRTRGRKSKYTDIDKMHLVRLWQLAGYPCSKRLQALLPEWLGQYKCGDLVKRSLLSMSASQMDEYLRQARHEHLKKVNSGTVPAKNHIKRLIRLRDPSVRYADPGYIESDTVLHCGDKIFGTYSHTVSATDLASGWTEGRGIFGKNAELVVQRLTEYGSVLPFKIVALFFDNGIEYVNHLLVQELKDRQGVDVARGRSGRSNDQCHIEQKNNTFVRQLFGHVRIEDPNLIPLMNEIYEVWGNLHNYFMPQQKLISKDRVGSKVIKKYDKPKTPYQRIIENPRVEESVKEKLRATKATLNPFLLQAELQKKLALFHRLNDAYNEKRKLERGW